MWDSKLRPGSPRCSASSFDLKRLVVVSFFYSNRYNRQSLRAYAKYPMETSIFLGIILVVIIGFAFFYTRTTRLHSKNDTRDDTDRFMLLQNQMQHLTRILDEKLHENQKAMTEQQHEMQRSLQSQFSHSTKIISEVTEKLTKLDETNRQVVSFTDQLQNLERILTNSKNRGNLGEAGLELILTNILPPGSFKMQYSFEDGAVVDAAVFVRDQILPVDAKFSLENYRRIIEESDDTKKLALEREFKNDLKRRIDETAKYIRPKENTLDFAFMFIPAEGIYYDLLVNEVGAVKVNTRSLIDYAFAEKKVIIVSPTTFAAYLNTVLQGLRALQIEESAKEIRKRVEQLGQHLSAYDSYMQKLGNNLGTAVNMYNQAYKEFGKIDKDVMRITGGERAVDPVSIDRPQKNTE